MKSRSQIPEREPEHPHDAAHGPASEPAPESLPRAEIHRHFGFSWIWFLPLSALVLVGYLAYSALSERGPRISITFQTADGLLAQETLVKYKAVTLGTVEDIQLSADLTQVVARVRMRSNAESLLTSNARFWVVRPRFSGGLTALQAGLETLVSGAYVALDPGGKGGKPQHDFQGLEKPPSIRSDEPGTVYFLDADTLGGLSEGAPIFYREVSVGELLSYELDGASEKVKLRIFVHAPYDASVITETRFWNTSGVRISSSAEGLRIELESVKSVFSGGISFQNPPATEQSARAAAESHFRLHKTASEAKLAFYGDSLPYVSYFQSSVSGLSDGSEVQLFGRAIGAVTNVTVMRDPRSGHGGELTARVAYVLQPGRALRGEDRELLTQKGIARLVDDHLRVVLKSSNFLTGQKVLSLEYVPGSRPEALFREEEAWVLPSDAQDFQDLSQSLAEIAKQINSIPFGEIGGHLNRTLASLDASIAGPELREAVVKLNATLSEVHGLAQEAKRNLGPALARLPRTTEKLEHALEQADAAFGRGGYGNDSSVQRNLERMMGQIADAARSIRLLADFLNRHPEALISGRKASQP